MSDRHVVTGVEPVWVRTSYERSESGEAVQTGNPSFEEWVDRDAAEYECSCGAVLDGYEAMVEHLELSDGQENNDAPSGI